MTSNRLLTIGYGLPNPRIDNHNFLNAPSFFDYSMMVVDPENVSKVIEDVLNLNAEYRTHSDERIENGPSTAVSAGLAEVLLRRKEEMERFLQNGGICVVLARPNRAHPRVTGFQGADRYYWLPAPSGVVWDIPHLMPGDGKTVRFQDESHAFSLLLRDHRKLIQYRAYFNDKTKAFEESGAVFARSTGNAAVGVQMRVNGGTVVFIPTLTVPVGNERVNLANSFLQACERTLHAVTEGEPPEWVSQFSLPGLDQAEREEADAVAKVAEAEERLSEARARINGLTRYRNLLWQGGQIGLGQSAADAMRLLGFDVKEDQDRHRTLACPEGSGFLEVEGAAEEVFEWPYLRLQRRLQEDLLKTRQPKAGVIVINGFRLSVPDERGEQATAQLRIASENYRYCLLPSTDLFEMVQDVLLAPEDEELKARLRRQILETHGLLSYERLQLPEEEIADGLDQEGAEAYEEGKFEGEELEPAGVYAAAEGDEGEWQEGAEAEGWAEDGGDAWEEGGEEQPPANPPTVF